ncbi:MAG: hypothetical protein BA066_05590, partial [Candidatus Korarchaeota archaeon NZ13-K]
AYYSSTLSIDTAGMSPGDYGVVVEGCSGSSCYRAYATLTVLEAPKPENINLIVYPLTLVGKPGDNLKVDVTVSIPGGKSPDALKLKVYAPPGWYVSYYPTTFYETSSVQLWLSIPKGTAQGTYSMGIELYKGETLLRSRTVVIMVKAEQAQLSVYTVPTEVFLSKEAPEAQVAVLVSSTGEVGDLTISLAGLPSGVSYSIPPKLRPGQLGVLNLTLRDAKEGNYTASIVVTGDGVSATGSFRVVVKGAQMTTTAQITQTETKQMTITETVRETVTVTSERAPALSDYLMVAAILLLLVAIAAILLTRGRSATPVAQGETPPPS